MDMNDILKMLKDPAALQRQAAEAQTRMAAVRVVGSAGGGMVRITMNGTMELIDITIEPEVIDPADPGTLRDLIKAAHNDAVARAREALQGDVMRSMGPLAGLGGMGGAGF